MSSKFQVHGFTRDSLREKAKSHFERGIGFSKAIHQSVMQKGDFESVLSVVSDESRQNWDSHFAFDLPKVVQVVEERHERGITSKAILKTHDGYEIECVNIPMGRDRYTLCLSSQIGCKMGCTFCETGRMGLIRHLETHEIVAQLLVARHVLGWKVRNLVFMGMGEAMDNGDAVVDAIRVFNDSAGLSIAQERMTVCTVGYVEGIERLKKEGFTRLNLSVSLNSANDDFRAQIMPIAKRTNLDKLQSTLVSYRPRRNFTLGVNYCLMPGLNDSQRDVEEIAAFCEPIPRVLVNVIPYNPGNDPITRAPSEAELVNFVKALKDAGLPVRMRITKGRSVMAACGQLGNVELRAEKRRRLAQVRQKP